MNETETHAVEEGEKEAPEVITFKEFLESVPPGHSRLVTNFSYVDRGYKTSTTRLGGFRLWLHCSSPECSGERYFDQSGDGPLLKFGGADNDFLTFRCSNCKKKTKRYSLNFKLAGATDPAQFIKYGEVPSFGSPVPNRLLRLLEDGGDKDLFLKGRQCENQGLGVGAFSYYRRVVESKKTALIHEILKVAETVNAPQATKDALNAAMKEHQFKTSVDMIKDAIPETLLINGNNPMTLLYSALSDGLHDRDDEHCLELAMSIRVVLSDLVQRVSEARKENDELKKALTNLATKQKGE